MSNVVDSVMEKIYRECRAKAKREALSEARTELNEGKKARADLIKANRKIRGLEKKLDQYNKDVKDIELSMKKINRMVESIRRIKHLKVQTLCSDSIYFDPFEKESRALRRIIRKVKKGNPPSQKKVTATRKKARRVKRRVSGRRR